MTEFFIRLLKMNVANFARIVSLRFIYMSRTLLFCFALFLLFTDALAQTRTINGRVIDREDNQPLPGTTIMVEGTSKGTTADLNGRFTLQLAANEDILVFSFIGFLTQRVTVGSQTELEVIMAPDTKSLEEVVVIGYGTVRKSDLTGAVSTVRGADLNKIPALSPMQALQGKVAGLQVTSASGAPGASVVVRVRGVGTFNNASPIYVVDGVILDNIDFLNSGDIESIEVLKDASATTIYGSRGANGVIMVTTRSGKVGQEFPTINFSTEYSMQTLQERIDLLNGREFAIIANEINPGSYNNVDAVPNTDWQDLLFRNAPIQNYQFSAAGAVGKSQYYIGVGYFNQQGIIPKSSFERLTIKLNNTYHLAKNVRFGNNLAFTPNQQQNTNGNAVFVVYRAQPTIEPYLSDGGYAEVPGVGNVLADLEYTNSFSKGLRTVGNFFGEVDIVPGLTFRSSFGIDMDYRKSRSFTPEFFVSPQQQNSLSRLSKNYSDRLSWLWENTINYSKTFGKSRIDAVAGYTMQESSSEFISLGAENLLRDDTDFWYFNPDNINPTTIGNNVFFDQNFSMISYLFRANHNYDERYLFTATYRTDGSSKFSQDNRYASFPAFAVGWNIINEKFMLENTWLSNLKVRASWGIVGNEKIQYDRQFSRVINGVVAVFGQEGQIYPGSTYGVTGNPGLGWEDTYQTDIGLEFGLWNNKLSVELDYYNRNTKNILIDLPVAGYLGNGDGAAITFNAADVLNRGLEYNLAWNGQARDIRYTIRTVGTTIHNEATRIFGTGDAGDRLTNGAGTTSTAPGQPIGSFFGYVTDGVFQNADELAAYPNRFDAGVGDLRFVDVNGDGVINDLDRTFLGSPIPKFIGGLGLDVFYKAFDISIDFQGQAGNKIYNAKETVRPDLYNFERHVFDRWRGDGTSNTEPRSTAGGYNWLPSTRFIQDGSFMRLRSLTLGYNLPQSLAERVYVRTARFYLRGTNVFTFTNFTGYSPEVTSESPINNGIDFGGYPVSSVYSVGLNVTF
jgi:TonB-linked SusC/RagA family outer membrane protein